MAAPGTRVVIDWDMAKITELTDVLPMAAHQRALGAAIEVGYNVLYPGGHAYRSTGKLGADLRKPIPLGPTSDAVGSNLVYAAIQNYGGTIRPVRAKRLLIHSDRRFSTRPGAVQPEGSSDISGRFTTREVVASASEVTLEGKGYLDAIGPAYVEFCMEELERIYPG